MQNQLLEANSPTEQLPNTSSPNVWDSLDPKMYMVAVKYAETGNYAAAAKEVGVRPETARKWGRDIRVAALVAHQLKQYEEVSLVSRTVLERMALDVYDVAMGNEDTHGVYKDGGSYSEPVTNLPAANQAVATLHRINHDTESRKIESSKSKAGQTVVLNIEQANFNSNQHFDMLKQRNGQTIEGEIIDGE